LNEKDTLDYKRIGQRIRDFRGKKKLSQADLADAAQISLSHISDIELGKTKMKLATFVRICETLQVSSDTLLRPNTPEVNGIYQNEFSELLKDCTPGEIDSILAIVKEIKYRMRNHHSAED